MVKWVKDKISQVGPTLPPTTRGTTPHGKEPLMVGGKVGGPLNANIDIWALFDTKKRENEPLAISNQKNLTEIKKNF